MNTLKPSMPCFFLLFALLLVSSCGDQGKKDANESEKPSCTVAWTYGILSRMAWISGDEEQAEMYVQKAESIDPDFSRAFAYPDVDDPPDKLGYGYRSYFQPF